MTLKPLLLIAPLAFGLTACDSAGTALDDTARLAAVQQCQQLSEGAGIAGPALNKVCGCAADKWLAKPVSERMQIDTASIRTIINECAGANSSTAPAQSTESY
ncbi:MAG: hypothetical protein JNJ92_11610 [Altererythrobacter sp.]|nr:hypothetical protein [Altererythrobacter sp.]